MIYYKDLEITGPNGTFKGSVQVEFDLETNPVGVTTTVKSPEEPGSLITGTSLESKDIDMYSISTSTDYVINELKVMAGVPEDLISCLLEKGFSPSK